MGRQADEDIGTQQSATILLKGEKVKLLPNKVLHWVSKRLMVVSDVHLGKAGHFRKHGIAVPGNIHTYDLHHLSYLLINYDVVELVFWETYFTVMRTPNGQSLSNGQQNGAISG